MPAPTTATDEAIIEAGQQLVAQGKRITGWTLKAIVGTGNASRLMKVWEAYADKAAELPLSQPPAPPLPAALEDQVSGLQMRVAAELEVLIGAVWTSAERIATERTRTEADAARLATAEMQADLEIAEQAVAAAEGERDEAMARAEDMMRQLAEVRGEADRQKGRAEAAETERSRLAGEIAESIRLAAAAQVRTERAEADAKEATSRARQAEQDARQAEVASSAAAARAEAADARAQRAEAAASEAVRSGAEERGRLLQRVEHAEADVAPRGNLHAAEAKGAVAA